MPKTENQRQRIAHAALKLFAARGYSATPISLIAKKAGVSQGLMYNFFKNKKDLLREIVIEGSADIGQSMEAYRTIKDPREAISIHVKKTVEIIKRKKEFWRLLHAIRLQGSVLDDVQDIFEKITVDVTKIFENVFRTLAYDQPRLEAHLFLTQIDGLVILFLQNEKIPIDKLALQLIKRYNHEAPASATRMAR